MNIFGEAYYITDDLILWGFYDSQFKKTNYNYLYWFDICSYS